MIEYVSFVSNIGIGPEFELMARISQGARVSGMVVDIRFDDDPRFVILDMKGKDRSFTQLVSLNQVLSVVVKPKKSDGKAKETK